MTFCLEDVLGCRDCEQEALFRDPDHYCGELCRMWAEAKAHDSEYHRLRHEPIVCEDCGAVVNDRRGNDVLVHRVCGEGCCNEWCFPWCSGVHLSEGPIDCRDCGSAQLFEARQVIKHLRTLRVSRMHAAYRRKRASW